MSKHILICKDENELIADKKDAIETLKELISNPPAETPLENISEWKAAIEKLEDEISEIDEERYYLVEKENEHKIIVDFWKKYQSNCVNEFNNGQLIEIAFTDSNDVECLSVIDFNGNEIIPECLEYRFIGDNIILLQYGYMFGSHYDDHFAKKWSIADTNIQGVNSIDYLKDYKTFLINDTVFLNEDLEYLGKRLIEEESESLMFINNDKKKGQILKGGKIKLKD